jgi:hypothetical protein
MEHYYPSSQDAPEKIVIYLANPSRLRRLRNAVLPSVHKVRFPELPYGEASVLTMELRVDQSG